MRNLSVFVLMICVLFIFTGCQDKGKDKGQDTASGEETSSTTEDTTAAADNKTTETETAGKTELKESKKTVESSDTTAAESKTTEEAKRELKSGEAGEVVYCQGDVEITRNGSVIDADIGTGVENWDMVKTGDSSSAELELRAALTPKTIIEVKENTLFTIDLNKLNSKDTTHIDMISGSIGLKVQKLSSSQDLTVTSDSALMGVRGTSFDVSTVPTGDVLITCSEGDVECKDKETGKKFHAKPGQAVESTAGTTPKTIKVAVTKLKEYRENWLDEKVRLLKNDALAQIKKYYKLYEKYSADFEKNYTALSSANGILDKWMKEDKEGKIGSNIDVMKEKKGVISHLMKIQKSLFWMQRIYYRLKKIEKYHDQGFGVGEIKPGLSTKEFFNSLNKSNFEAKLSKILFVHKLYAKRNKGSTPLDAFMEGMDDFSMDSSPDDGFFDDNSDDFFND
ncbi:MAG: FecR domain-containing protein [Spirochaetales bacterium]|nr:FecR domain-containing protein [Spirochaetales bacterium]